MDTVTPPRPERLVPVASLREFFRDSVGAAMATNHVVVDCDTSHYVVNLLTLFARSDALFDPADPGRSMKPLALMLADAVQSASSGERNCTLQRLGDVSLFVAGFFAEGLHRKSVGVDYYVNMGCGAYRTLSMNIYGTTRGRALAGIFRELAEKFQDVVDVLHEVRDSARGCPDRDVLRLYECWLTTGSRRAGRLLRQAGVEPNAQALTPYQH